MPQIGVAIAGLVGAFQASAVGTFLTTTIAGRLLTTVAMTALSQALAPKPKVPGIKTSSTAGGGVNPLSFIVGTYATAGVAACPAMSHGKVAKTPNAYLTYVIELSDIPGVALNRLIIDGEYVTLGPTPHADYGSPAEGRLAGYAWCKFYDGTQTVADPMLLAKYGSYPDRPWSADMIGRGVAHAILTFRYNRKIFNGLPQVRFEMLGIPLYDPRADTTVGGSGAQRWSTPSTWARTDNPMVMAYNIARGITLPDGSIWGGDAQAPDLPLSAWFAAMNACDVAVPLAAGGTEPKYRAGLEITVDEDPASVLEELFKACSGQIADIGGSWTPRVGGPGLPVYLFSDDDAIATRPQDFDPFHGLDQTFNGISATYPEPASLWESKQAPPRYNATWETQDGGRRLVADLGLPAVPYKLQVQRLMRAYINDERRFRRHVLTLPPPAAIIEPLDALGWTSARNGYTSKVFEVAEVVDDPMTLLQTVSLRERDATDYDWSTGDELATTTVAATVVQPAAQTVPLFDVQAVTLTDAASANRRPALKLVWDGAELDDVRAIEWQVRRAGTTAVLQSGSTHLVDVGALTVSDGILPATDYEARARCVVDRPSDWTAWDAATTDGVYVQDADFGPGGVSAMFQAAGLSAPRIVGALPAAGPSRFVGELVFLTTDFKLYRWDGTGWTTAVPTADLTGKVASSQLIIADLSNLCEDPSFELDGLGWGAVSGGGGYTVAATDARTGSKCASRTFASGMAAASAYRNNLTFDVAAGDTFLISGWVKVAAGAVCTSAGVRISWLDGSGAEITTSAATIAAASLTTTYLRASAKVTAPAGSVRGRAELVVFGHSAGTIFWDDIYCYRANAGELTVDGTIFGNHIAANSLTAGLFAAAAIKAQDVDIDGLLFLNALTSGFTMGKTSAFDLVNDGIYFGRTNEAGVMGFGLLAGRFMSNGSPQYMQITKNKGLRLLNAQHFVTSVVPNSQVTVATSQTVTLPVTTTAITLEILGGGGGGASGQDEAAQPRADGGTGGTTRVELWDGTTNTGVFWQATGAVGGTWYTGSNLGTAGANSVYGTGGAGGTSTSDAGDNATGYGAGGGGGYGNGRGGQGGKAATLLTITDYDVEALANPKLVITIGAAGTGGADPGATTTAGGNGSKGVVKYVATVSKDLPADVVPLVPTAQGTFSKTANGTNNFPSTLGPGLWVLDAAGSNLQLGDVEVDTYGGVIHIPPAALNATFFSAKLPKNISVNANARTISYAYYKMSTWGGT